MTLMVTLALVEETEDGAQYAEQQQGNSPPAIGTLQRAEMGPTQAGAFRDQGHP